MTCFHTIKSILNAWNKITQALQPVSFHTIKSILNAEAKTDKEINELFPYY